MLISLDERLKAVAEQFPLGSVGADIGADHGKLSAYLLKNNICSYMYVSDISKASVAKSKRLLEKHDVLSRATVMCSDGFNDIPHDVQAAAVCGLGGNSVASIIKPLSALNIYPKLILSPHTDLPVVRRALMQIRYKIVKETIVFVKGRFYNVITAEQGAELLSEKEIYTGKNICAASYNLLIDYYTWRYNVEKSKKTDNNLQLQWILEELHCFKKQQ